MSLLSSAEFFLEIIVFKRVSFMNMSRVSNNVDPDNAGYLSLIWVQAVEKV